MDLENSKTDQNIKIIFISFIIVMGLEIIFASWLLFTNIQNRRKINQEIINQNNKLKSISEIEKKIKEKKSPQIIKEDPHPPKPKEIDTNPRTRPIFNPSFE